MNKYNRLNLLLVEDNPGDIKLVHEFFIENKIVLNIHAIRDGEEALTYLRKEKIQPDLILLDLMLPNISGQFIMKELNKDEKLSSIPIIVLTVLNDDVHLLEAYKLHASAFITKPLTFIKFMEALHMIGKFNFFIVSKSETSPETP